MDEEQHDETVAVGAKLLDEVVPGWHRKVNLKGLDMSSGYMCMLGQLFGHDVETSVAKEMYPKLWAKHRTHSGYNIGKSMIPKLRKINPVPEDETSNLGYRWDRKNEMWKAPSDLQDEVFLATACAGSDNRCAWAKEVADRLAKDDEQSLSSPVEVKEDGHV